MIGFKDSLTIASAKFLSQKRKTILTIVVSGVLFGFLLGVLIISRSALSSVEEFSGKVLDGRQLVLATKIDTTNEQLMNDPELIKKAESIFRNSVVQKQQYAQSIGYNYDPSQETPVSTVNPGDPASKQLNLASPIAKKIVDEARQLSSDFRDLKMLAGKHNYQDIFSLKSVTVTDGAIKQENASVAISGINELFGNGQAPYLVKDSILNPYMGTSDSNSDAIPIVVPFSVAEAKLGLPRLSSAASAKEKIDRMKAVRERSSKLTFTMCYRNGVSQDLTQQAMQDTKTQLQATGIAYEMSKDYCGEPMIAQDTRSVLQKQNQEKQNGFKRYFGEVVTPVQKTLTFRVAGVTPDSLEGAAKDNISRLFLSSLSPPGFGFSAIPTSAIAKLNKTLPGVVTQDESSGATPMKQYLIEFSSSDHITRFLKENQCDPSIGCSGGGFTFTQFGSSSVQLKNMSETLEKIYAYATATVAFIAIIVLGGTFSKIVADSRQETAVFRALGGRRFDIVKIYLTYSLVLSLMTIAFAVGLGYILSLCTHLFYAEQLFVELQSTYGIIESLKSASLVSFVPNEIALAAILIVIAAALSMGLSLVGNLGRSITSDLRSE